MRPYQVRNDFVDAFGTKESHKGTVSRRLEAREKRQRGEERVLAYEVFQRNIWILTKLPWN